MVTESGKTFLSEIFFFLLSVDIGCAALLLRLYSFAAAGRAPHRRYPRFVCRKARPSGRAFLRLRGRGESKEKQISEIKCYFPSFS